MVPFSRIRLSARRLVVFDESQGSQHPLHAIRIANSSGQTLDGGALTVFDEGGYAGDALVETINSGDERIISYAVDLGTRISTAFDGESRLQRKFQIKNGIMTTQRVDSEVKTFTIHNVDVQPKTVVIEHAVRGDYQLIGNEPVEKTADSYRFEVAAPPRETVKYAIREERLQSESLELSDLDFDDLKLQIDNQELDPAGRAALQRIADTHHSIDKQGEEEKRIRERADELIRDQTRLRQNIETLNAVTGQAQRVQEYASRLAQIDDEIAQSRRRLLESQARNEELDQQLEKLIAALEF
jgi:dynactin complex subunit